jgi:hypothetical protein
MTEKKEASWVDYSNLAANLVQIGQLSAVQERLKQLAEIETARAERIQLINKLRQVVFETENGLLQIGEYVAKAPTGVLIAVSILKATFDNMGIVPETFEEFADKDRVKQVSELIQSRVNESSQHLSQEQRSEAQRMIVLVPKLSDLDTLIKANDAKDELARTDLEWTSLVERQQKALSPWKNLMGFSVLLWIVGFPLAGLISGPNQLLWIIVLFGLPTISFAISVANLTKIPKRLGELEQLRTPLEKLLLPVARELELVNEFGAKTNDELKVLKSDVIAYMERATTQDSSGNELPTSLLSMVKLQSLLEQGRAG